MRFATMVALAAPLVSAIEFVAPEANSTLSKGEEYHLKWDTVDTDPGSFSIYLVNFFNWPPLYTPLAYDIETSAGWATVKVPCGVDTSYGYQFNAINGTNTYVIYAQTPKFYISGGPCIDPTPLTPTCAAATVTVTATITP
ncbi:Ser-Thr-rich glycosyl-phosphatidyl-inositol-anchored membrane family-domain-containing protein [Lasiosphaeris hirsuta]|uniref:Ser-Thr-rich glycosyl-phosphatidyl-inositol-anchored membrane family-domain-containing protein n=1 Tax=Lasiosphaeris hirsuta TaxID=260670 RepID=A0AA40EB85_9PEZI|nr:Ser-Thr-rich glycosyl-phosphatidyl-inositol-anchored membrane family-domain-containing protein [Lasiosphaeris hirsuta]